MSDPNEPIHNETTIFVPTTIHKENVCGRCIPLILYKDQEGKVSPIYYEFDMIHPSLSESMIDNSPGIQANKIEGEGAFRVEGAAVGFKLHTGLLSLDGVFNTWYVSKGYRITMDLNPDGYFVVKTIKEDPMVTQGRFMTKMLFNCEGSTTKFEGVFDPNEIVGSECFVACKELNVLLSNDTEKISTLFEQTFTVLIDNNLP